MAAVAEATHYMAAAETHARRGDYAQAAREYEKAPPSLAVHCGRATCLMKTGEFQRALEAVDDMLRLEPESAQALFMKGECLYALAQFEFALVYYHRAVRLRPQLRRQAVRAIGKAQEAIRTAFQSFHRVQGQGVESKSGSSDQALLGELYEDMVFLEQLKNDPIRDGEGACVAAEPIAEALAYLGHRLAFWRERKPFRDMNNMMMASNRIEARPHRPTAPTAPTPTTPTMTTTTKKKKVRARPATARRVPQQPDTPQRSRGARPARRPTRPRTATNAASSTSSSSSSKRHRPASQSLMRGRDDKEYAKAQRVVARLDEVLLNRASGGEQEIDAALRLGTKTLKSHSRFHDMVAALHDRLGQLHKLKGNGALALVHFGNDYELSVRYAIDGGALRALTNIALTHREAGNVRESVRFWRKTVQREKEAPSVVERASLHCHLAETLLSDDQHDEAIAEAQRALQLLDGERGPEAKETRMDSHMTIGSAAMRRKDAKAMALHFGEAANIARALGHEDVRELCERMQQQAGERLGVVIVPGTVATSDREEEEAGGEEEEEEEKDEYRDDFVFE